MFDWCHVCTTTVMATGETEICHSHTPEEFVAEMRARNERLFVANKSCCECIYTPDCLIPKNAVHNMTEEMLSLHRYPECICSTIARRMIIPVPDFVLCYGFYYQYWHRNKYLLAAKEADLITFFDVSDLPSFERFGHRPSGPVYFI